MQAAPAAARWATLAGRSWTLHQSPGRCRCAHRRRHKEAPRPAPAVVVYAFISPKLRRAVAANAQFPGHTYNAAGEAEEGASLTIRKFANRGCLYARQPATVGRGARVRPPARRSARPAVRAPLIDTNQMIAGRPAPWSQAPEPPSERAYKVPGRRGTARPGASSWRMRACGRLCAERRRARRARPHPGRRHTAWLPPPPARLPASRQAPLLHLGAPHPVPGGTTSTGAFCRGPEPPTAATDLPARQGPQLGSRGGARWRPGPRSRVTSTQTARRYAPARPRARPAAGPSRREAPRSPPREKN